MIELRENEYQIFSILKEIKSEVNIRELSRRAGLSESAIVKGLLLLSKFNLIELIEEKRTFVRLNEEGLTYHQLGLPENRLANAVLSLGGVAEVENAIESAHISKEMIPIVLGWLRRKGLAIIRKEKGEIFLEVSKKPKETAEENLLSLIHEKGQVSNQDLSEEIRKIATLLKKRNLIEESQKTIRKVKLTAKGMKINAQSIKMVEGVTALDSRLITTGEWRKVKLLEYDVTSSPPAVYPGKRHFYIDFMEEARKILIAMGFEESDGPFVETEFWNFDVLFQAQDHPAREIHDSYMLKDPKIGAIENEELMEKVKKTHEDGWTTGSRGWGYKWSSNITRRLVLRTQTTAVSMRYLNKHKKPPTKMFCLSKVFRPDVLDAKHSMEFTQLEGIVGDKKITLRHLLGLLQKFAAGLGLGEVKFRPGYFPFTEPSVESFVKHPNLGWIEFVGAGMFRPEVLKPLEIKFPVIAWGIGLDRLAMIRLGIDDIRELYSKRLELLRERKL